MLQGPRFWGTVERAPWGRRLCHCCAHIYLWVTVQHPDAGLLQWEVIASGSELCGSAVTDTLQGNDGVPPGA